MSTPPHDPDFETLSAYLDGELDAAERARVEAYLAAHPETRTELEQLRSLDQAAAAPHPDEREFDVEAFSRRMWDEVDRQKRRAPGQGLFGWRMLWVPAAAAAAFLLVMNVPSVWNRRPAPEQGLRTAVTTPMSAPVESSRTGNELSADKAAQTAGDKLAAPAPQGASQPAAKSPEAGAPVVEAKKGKDSSKRREDALRDRQASPGQRAGAANGEIMQRAYDEPPAASGGRAQNAVPPAAPKEEAAPARKPGTPASASAPPVMTGGTGPVADQGLAKSMDEMRAKEMKSSAGASAMKSQPFALGRQAAPPALLDTLVQLELGYLGLEDPVSAAAAGESEAKRWVASVEPWEQFVKRNPKRAEGWEALSRSYLERFRAAKQTADLASARSALAKGLQLKLSPAEKARLEALRAIVEAVAAANRPAR